MQPSEIPIFEKGNTQGELDMANYDTKMIEEDGDERKRK